MTWTYSDLKAADAALGIDDPAAAAVALNAQTTTLTDQVILWRNAKRTARESTTGDWSRIVARARLQPSLPPTSGTDVAILAAINAVESADNDMIDPNDPGSWGAWQNGLAALHGVGDLSDTTVAALNELTTQTAPRWQPPLNAGDIQTARERG